MTSLSILVAVLTMTSEASAQDIREGRFRGHLDGDGIEECWRVQYDGGSGYGWWTLSVRAPCNKALAHLRVGGSFGDFVSIAPVPAALLARPRILEGLLARVFEGWSQRSLSDIDGSLRWLIDFLSSPKNSRHLELHWESGEPRLPKEQVLILRTPEEQSLARALGRRLIVEGEQPVTGAALMVYFAHNHGTLHEAARAGELGVYLSDHAVAVKDHRSGKWAWAFVTSDAWKLRVPTMVRAETDGTRVAVERIRQEEGGDGRHELIVIDPRAGTWKSQPLNRKHWSLSTLGP